MKWLEFKNTGKSWPDNWVISYKTIIGILMMAISLIVVVLMFKYSAGGSVYQFFLGVVCGGFLINFIIFAIALLEALIRKVKGSS